MGLYVVGHEGRELWLAYVDTGSENPGVYAYVANLGRFVFHKSLGQDFHWDRELDWTAVDEHTARTIISAGAVGALDESLHDWLLAELAAETDQRDVEDVLGSTRP